MSGAISAAVPSPKRKPPTVVASGLPLLFFQLSALWPLSLSEVGRELPSAALTTFSKLLIIIGGTKFRVASHLYRVCRYRMLPALFGWLFGMVLVLTTRSLLFWTQTNLNQVIMYVANTKKTLHHGVLLVFLPILRRVSRTNPLAESFIRGDEIHRIRVL